MRPSTAPGQRTLRVGLGLGLVLGLGLTQSRLLGILGVESALALGLVLPGFAAALGALEVARARRLGLAPGALGLLSLASRRALLLLAVPVSCLWLHGASTQSCDPWTGALFVLLGPGLGVLLGSFVGVSIGVLVPRRRLAVTLAVAAPLVSASWGVWQFYSGPGIFVFDPFVGYFPGTIYDRSVRVTQAYLSYRAGSVLALLTLAAGLHALHTPGLAGWSLARARRHLLAFGVFALGLAGLGAMQVYAPELGHRADEDHIVEVLGRTLESHRCVVHVPREMALADATRLGRDCDFRVAEAESTLGVRQTAKVVAFFYRSASEKRQLMGADETFIAKPWRNEVHLQLAGWPHPVLAHEVAHVVAANTARGPFRLGGSLGGWWPNAGLIEGLAVAVAFRSQHGLTPDQWAHAMLELDHMPSLESVMGAGFLNSSAAQSYTVAGSFLRWLATDRDWSVVRRAYRDGDIEAAAHSDLHSLEEHWHAYLRTVPLPPEALELARMRFERPGVVHAICPHAIADLLRRLDGDTAAGDDVRLRETCHEILAMDPANLSAKVAQIGALARMGELDTARQALVDLRERLRAPTPYRIAADAALADALVQRGAFDEARPIYRRLLDQPQSEGSARLLEVKAWALEQPAEARTMVFDLLLGPDLRGSAPRVVVHLAAQLAALDGGGLGPYLAARQLFASGRYDLARPMLIGALDRGLSTRRLTVEAERLTAIASFATDDMADARMRFARIRDDTSRSVAARAEADEWLRRARYEATFH